MNKHIEHALREWAEVKGYKNVNTGIGPGCMDCSADIPYEVNYDGGWEYIRLELNWWREVPVRDRKMYFAHLDAILEGSDLYYADPPDDYTLDHIERFHNATIEQRCEAKYKADTQ